MQRSSSVFESGNNVSSLIHKGTVLGTVQKAAPRLSHLASPSRVSNVGLHSNRLSAFNASSLQSSLGMVSNINGSHSANNTHNQNQDSIRMSVNNTSMMMTQTMPSSFNAKLKLKSVSKMEHQLPEEIPKLMNFDYILLVFCDQNDSPEYQFYVQKLKASSNTYKKTIRFVESTEQLQQTHKKLKQKHIHRTFVLLVGHYSAVHFRKSFKQMDEVILMLDSQQKYANCSYMMKESNMKRVFYDFYNVDRKLIEMNILFAETPLEELPSRIIEREAENKENSDQVSQSLQMHHHRRTNSKQTHIQGSEEAESELLPMDSCRQSSEKTQSPHCYGISDENSKTNIQQSYQIPLNGQQIEKRSSSKSIPREPILSSSNQQSKQQEEKRLFALRSENQNNITFKRISIKNSSSLMKNLQIPHSKLSQSESALNNNPSKTQTEKLISVYYQYDEELKKVKMDSIFEKPQSSIKTETILRGKNKVSLPWYSKFRKTEGKLRQRRRVSEKSSKENENADTADTEFYTRKSSHDLQLGESGNIGVQCQLIK